MRLILTMLAVANLRWAKADLDRSERLYVEGDTAFAQAERRRLIAERLIVRAHRNRPALAPHRAF